MTETTKEEPKSLLDNEKVRYAALLVGGLILGVIIGVLIAGGALTGMNVL